MKTGGCHSDFTTSRCNFPAFLGHSTIPPQNTENHGFVAFSKLELLIICGSPTGSAVFAGVLAWSNWVQTGVTSYPDFLFTLDLISGGLYLYLS